MESRLPEGLTDSRSSRKKLWKHSFFFILILVLAAALVLTVAGGRGLFRSQSGNAGSVRAAPSAPAPRPPDVALVRPLLKNGDVILRSGIGLWSEQIRAGNTHDKRFSHVGVVCIEPDGSYRVIHAEANDLTGSGEVFFDTLEHFVGESTEIGIARLHVSDPDALAEAAKTFIGRPFDWKFNSADDSAIYCTELVDLSLRKIDPELRLPMVNGVIQTEACLMPEYFTEIPVGK